MSKLRIRPKSDFLHVANWDELYLLTRHWQSDIDYFRDELKFLDSLLSKYFILLIKEEKMSKMQQLANEIAKLKKREQELVKALDKHLANIGLLIEDAFTGNEMKFRNDHAQLEEDIAEFNVDFRKMKKEIFTITEHVMESEKLQHLLTS